MGRLKPVVGTGQQERVVFCGPLGVGKTTAVRAVSDVEVADTDVRRAPPRRSKNKDGSVDRKRTTTVGIDYGEWHRDDGGAKVAVYGTPGQVRFEMVRSTAVSQKLRLVLWLFGQNDYAIDEADEWLRYLGAKDKGVYDRITVAVTRLDEPGDHPALEDYRELLDRYAPGIPLVAADPRDRESVQRAIDAAVGPRVGAEVSS
ncbi:ATP/GTP-binding protein [Phycicoccus sp. CSK15P-2]|uniref:GTP-binding protein n=1 Tax=Phycicoccus sp. CSK15P-2 TaxID=2807627 RepID=UPI00194DC4AE|nr:ATP/GTP-binding protein [Phycicoccus sp. CSK15P-2]MBM6404461.1 ATP/GTP-binding protein [Phycicoccus sp. CSK15P-2]